MAKSREIYENGATAPDLLVHLEQAFGWSEAQAIDALGTYMMSTEAGQALRRELSACNQSRRAA